MMLLASLILAAAPLQQLLQGNDRYANDASMKQKEERAALVGKQAPIAVVVGCSDSRVPPEIIFDQYLGDLFVVRVAGNVLGPMEMDSIEFAVKTLKVKLIFVLGHQGCGAVNAVLTGEALEDDLSNISPFIEPAVDETKYMPGDHLENAIKANVKNVMGKLSLELQSSKDLTIVGGYYHLDTGKVDMIKN
jgi:carbonic anhydrase